MPVPEHRVTLCALAALLGVASDRLAAEESGLPSPPAAAPGLLTLDAIRVSDISVAGSSVFSDQELAAYTAPYENRMLRFEDLQELSHWLSAAYLRRGYVNSGVVIPDQPVENGVVVLQAIEGGLGDIEVAGNRRLRDRAVTRRLERRVSHPLDIAELQESLRVLQEDPLVAQVNAQLLPGNAPGESFLRLAVTERPPLELAIGANNHRPASVGEDQGSVALSYRGLIGNGDAISATIGGTDGATDYALSYAVPLNAKGTQLEVFATDQESDIVENPFDEIDISSRLDSWGMTALLPFARGIDGSVTGIVGFERRRSESTLLGMPFSFSPGDVDGKARGAALTLGTEWTRRSNAQAFALRGLFRIGIDALDATKHADGADTEFTLFQGQFQYLRDMGWRESRLLVRAMVQASRDPLLAMYKLPVGGRFSVRGYRENQLVRDNGATASLEYRFPPIVDDTGQPNTNFNLALFVDYGVSWDEDGTLATSAKRKLYSAGLGLLWDPLPSVHTEIYWGADLADRRGSGDALQDDGVHYQLAFRKEF